MKKLRVQNKKIDDELLMRKRREELDKWPTGKEVDFEEAVAYQKSLPDSKIWWKVMVKLREEGRMSVFPRAGTPVLEQMIEQLPFPYPQIGLYVTQMGYGTHHGCLVETESLPGVILSLITGVQ